MTGNAGASGRGPGARGRGPGASETRHAAVRIARISNAVRQIPRGKVATYGQIAAAAGYPMYRRQVVQVLRSAGGTLPWQRVVGAGGAIKLPGAAGREQRFLLEMEGVRFRGRRIDMAAHQHLFKTRDAFRTSPPAKRARRPRS